jgi:hypothetical protein
METIKNSYRITKEERDKINSLEDIKKDDYIYEICKREGTTYTKILAQLQEPQELIEKEKIEEDRKEESEHEIDIEDLQPVDYDKRTLKVNILDIFKPGVDDMTLTSSGNYKMICPDCGLQGGRTEGFIVYPESNQASCHSSGKWFKVLEAYALKKKLIRCLDGREPGEKDKKVLGGELWTQTLLEFKDEYGVDRFNDLCEDWGIKKRLQIPGKFRLQSAFADDAAKIFCSRNLLFLRAESGNIIKIKVTKKVDKDNDEKMLTIERGIEELTPEEFVTLLELYVDPYMKTYYKDGTFQEAPYSINKETAGITLASPNFRFKMPPLERIFDIQIPIVHKGKLTFPKKGYDRRFASYLPPNAPKIRPNVYTVQDAKDFIEGIFQEFCFKDRKDFMHALAAFITPFCRGLFSKFSVRTPVFIYMANRERAGKDYLAGCTGMLYEGVATEQPPISTDEKGGFGNSNEELRKKITSCMIEGKKRFHSSNNKGLLNNSVLESATTLDTWEDRVLGRNKTINYPNEMEYSLSGNIGMSLTPDLVNRARVIDLELTIEDANSRVFKNPRLHAWILDNRESIISALYAIVKHWWENGAKPGKVPFTSFPEWSEVVGGIMESVGWDNPCTKDEVTVIALDQETDEMKILFETAYEQKPNTWLNLGELQEIVEKDDIMPDLDLKNKSDQIKFGKLIAKYGNRILSDITMYVKDNKQSQRRKYKFNKSLLAQEADKETIIDKDNKESIIDKKNEEVKENLTESEKTDQKVRMLPMFAHVSTPSHDRKLEFIPYSDTKTCADMRNMRTPLTQPETSIKTTILSKDVVREDLENIPKHPHPSTSTGKPLDYYTKKMAVAKQEEIDKRLKKVRSERELQFWEDPQCASIVAQCTREQTLEYVKANPKSSYEKIRLALGLGSSKWLVELANEGLIKRNDDESWEIVI